MNPDYGNLGVLAIGYAQEEFLRSHFPNYNIVRVPYSRTFDLLRSVRRQLSPGDLLFIAGGGFMGNFYPGAQRQREFIVQYFETHAIISFPQSLVYLNGDADVSSARRERRILGRSNNLILCARETPTLAMMRELFQNRLIYVPDIVFSLSEMDEIRCGEADRRGVLLTLREDRERMRSTEEDRVIFKVLSKLGKPVQEKENLVNNDDVNQDAPYSLALAQIHRYQQAEVVITDRLHGMIFAAITGTPCVVLPNTNHKIAATYHDWILNRSPHVLYLDTLNEINLTCALTEVMSCASRESEHSQPYDFGPLLDEIDAQIIESTKRVQ